MIHTQQSNNVIGFLDEQGLLEHGTNQQIAEAKKLYWKQIRNTWKKEMRKSSKAFTIYYNPKEFVALTNNKCNASQSFTRFIKDSSLSTPHVAKESIGKVRASIMKQLQILDTIIETNALSTEAKQLSEPIAIIETEIMQFLASLIQ